VRNLGELVDYVTGERYRSKMFAFSSEQLLFERLPRFWGQLVSELGLFGLLFPAGAVVCKHRWAAGVLSLAFLAELVWVTSYDIPDIEVYIIPVALLASILAGIALEAVSGSGRVRGLSVAGLCFLSVAALPYYNRTNVRHEKSVRFDEELDSTLEALGHDAVVVGRVNYGERMGLVYHLVALGKSAERNVYLAYEARPEQVARYLRGRGKLKDSHTDQPVPHGLRVYITRRAEKEGWRNRSEFSLGDRRAGLRQLTLR
jgi:hypothetical protein